MARHVRLFELVATAGFVWLGGRTAPTNDSVANGRCRRLRGLAWHECHGRGRAVISAPVIVLLLWWQQRKRRYRWTAHHQLLPTVGPNASSTAAGQWFNCCCPQCSTLHGQVSAPTRTANDAPGQTQHVGQWPSPGQLALSSATTD